MLLLTLQDLLTIQDRKVQVDIAILDFSKNWISFLMTTSCGSCSFTACMVLFWMGWSPPWRPRPNQLLLKAGVQNCPACCQAYHRLSIRPPIILVAHYWHSQHNYFVCLLIYGWLHPVPPHMLHLKPGPHSEGIDGAAVLGETWDKKFDIGSCHIMHINRSQSLVHTFIHYVARCYTIWRRQSMLGAADQRP